MGNLSQLEGIGLASAAGGAVTSAVSGFGQYEAGQEQKAAYDYNAAVALEKKRQDQQTTEGKYSTLIGKQASAYAAAGVDIASGSPLLVMAHTAAQGGEESSSEAQSGDQGAALERYYGKMAAFSSTINGINTFISGLSKAGMSAAGIFGSGGSYGTVPTVPNSMFPG